MTAFDSVVARLVVTTLLLLCVRYTGNTFFAELCFNKPVHLQISLHQKVELVHKKAVQNIHPGQNIKKVHQEAED